MVIFREDTLSIELKKDICSESEEFMLYMALYLVTNPFCSIEFVDSPHKISVSYIWLTSIEGIWTIAYLVLVATSVTS